MWNINKGIKKKKKREQNGFLINVKRGFVSRENILSLHVDLLPNSVLNRDTSQGITNIK